MMPHTVPKRPMNGAVLAVVARNVRPRSRRVTSCVRARCIARCTFSTPPNSVVLVVARVAALRLGEALQLLVAGAEHLRDGALLQVAARRLDGRQVLRVPEDVDEARRLPARAPHLEPLRERDAPSDRREADQDEQHEAHHPARAHRSCR